MGKIAEILGKITEVVYLSVLWIVFSLPIFTIGASTTALYYTVTKAFLDDRGYITREFVNSFKSNFKQSTIVWLIVALVLVILLGEFWFLRIYVSDEYYDVLLVVLLYLAINLAMFVNCLFPSIARFQTTIKQLYKNCIIIILTNLPWNILALVILLVAVFIVYLLPITILFIPTVYMICESKIFERIFQKYIKE